MASDRMFVCMITAIYWIGVMTGSLSHVAYTNGNADTFIHDVIRESKESTNAKS